MRCSDCGRFVTKLGVRTFAFKFNDFHDWTLRIGFDYCRPCDVFTAYTMEDDKYNRFIQWMKGLLGATEERDKKITELMNAQHELHKLIGEKNNRIRDLESAVIDKAIAATKK